MKTAEEFLEHLEILNQAYLWTIRESEKIIAEVDEAWSENNFEKVEELRHKFIEIENRHNVDRVHYNKVIKASRNYFKKKYKIDLFRIFELEDI